MATPIKFGCKNKSSHFPQPDVIHCKTFCLRDCRLDDHGFEDAVRPKESDPIQLCFRQSITDLETVARCLRPCRCDSPRFERWGRPRLHRRKTFRPR